MTGRSARHVGGGGMDKRYRALGADDQKNEEVGGRKLRGKQ